MESKVVWTSPSGMLRVIRIVESSKDKDGNERIKELGVCEISAGKDALGNARWAPWGTSDLTQELIDGLAQACGAIAAAAEAPKPKAKKKDASPQE